MRSKGPCVVSEIISNKRKGYTTYEKLVGKFELYKLLDEGIKATKKQKVRPFRDALDDIQKGLS